MKNDHRADIDLNQKSPAKNFLNPLSDLKGIGKVIAGKFRKKGIQTLSDLLYSFPLRYQDRRQFTPLGNIKSGETVLIKGTIVSIKKSGYRFREIVETVVEDNNGSISAKWIRPQRQLLSFKKGDEMILFGKFLRSYKGTLETYHPEIIESNSNLEMGRILPVYSEIEGVSQRRIRRIVIDAILQTTKDLVDPLPLKIRERRELPELENAIKELHFPRKSKIESLHSRKSPAQRRLIFDEFFLLQLTLAMTKSRVSREKGIAFKINRLNELCLTLPYSLTKSQLKAIHEITADMSRPSPMKRLLQGDVGCGKTVVALIAASVAVSNGFQVAFMAPTQVLAEQHYLNTLELACKMKLRAALLTSKMGKHADDVKIKVRQGDVDILIGTHALIQDSVKFKRLGLAIIDEQHRFGVEQREILLRQNDIKPDMLNMTATPIPRTLGLTVYGDLDLSIIDELPPGRKPVQTSLFSEKDRDKVYAALKEEISMGKQAYMVYPLLEESGKIDLKDATRMADNVRRVFPDFRITLMHGKMPIEKRTEIIQLFKEGEIDILVATTVIEVGIDIPNATLMVIENAERFGLSQIHQLRGRIGRDEYQSKCLLIASSKKTDNAVKRLKIIEQSTDGFKIAEEDLSIRGPGEFLGIKQSGFYQFKAANIIRDTAILSEARDEAFKLVELDSELAFRTRRLLGGIFKDNYDGLTT